MRETLQFAIFYSLLIIVQDFKEESGPFGSAQSLP